MRPRPVAQCLPSLGGFEADSAYVGAHTEAIHLGWGLRIQGSGDVWLKAARGCLTIYIIGSAVGPPVDLHLSAELRRGQSGIEPTNFDSSAASSNVDKRPRVSSVPNRTSDIMLQMAGLSAGTEQAIRAGDPTEAHYELMSS